MCLLAYSQNNLHKVIFLTLSNLVTLADTKLRTTVLGIYAT
ncbi:hypothetical protein GLIP_2618 [Aliiglaciecola lipolytica E3]|uniref:Uncharacterized protein n=1 Tax=Aliiglaciecola lipolytica E3 TaxID=1127673 RepID=K6YF35_9ALTE|nr:hypothetical protein GLIP_2618 [Aliiglaciecola lipolytica E3]